MRVATTGGPIEAPFSAWTTQRGYLELPESTEEAWKGCVRPHQNVVLAPRLRNFWTRDTQMKVPSESRDKQSCSTLG